MMLKVKKMDIKKVPNLNCTCGECFTMKGLVEFEPTGDVFEGEGIIWKPTLAELECMKQVIDTIYFFNKQSARRCEGL